MNINRKLDEILLNYDMLREVSCDKATSAIRNLEESFLSGHKIGIYGVGIEAEGLLYFISSNTKCLKIDCCFDKTIRNYQYKDFILNTEVYPIEQIPEMAVDYLILGSCEYRKAFFENLNILGYQGEVVDLFGFMEDYMADHFTDYKKVYETRQAYLNADCTEKSRLLPKLIKNYILLKDFTNAFRYIDMYVAGRYPDSRRYETLKKDLQLLLQDVKDYIKRRRKKDIIINWVDALSYYDIHKFPFLKRKTEEGICFENAYTVMPWTTETTKIILSGEYPIEGRLFLRGNLSEENMKLLRLLKNNGYEFRYCGMPRFAKLFEDPDIAYVHCFENKFSGSMQKQWDALDILCKTEEPVCILIHTLRETHEPFICGDGDTLQWFGSSKADWQQENCKRQAEHSGQYIDRQLEFYEKFYGENAVKIYMSDHGRVGNSPMDDNKIHIMFAISGKNVPPMTIKSMFSLVKFPDVIKKIILNEKDWESLTDEYVRIENLDAYNELVVQKTLAGELSREEMYQCRGVVTASEKYFLYAYGKEYYFIDDMLYEKKPDDSLYEERIPKLKKICGETFIDIFKYEKFRYSRELYKDIRLDTCGFM